MREVYFVPWVPSKQIDPVSYTHLDVYKRQVLETCFISDQDDVTWYQTNKKKIAAAIVAGVQEGFHLNYRSIFAPYLVKVDVASIPDHVLNIREQPTVNSSITGKITETMQMCIRDRINSVSDFDFDLSKKGIVHVSFVVNTIFGDIETERTVNF